MTSSDQRGTAVKTGGPVPRATLGELLDSKPSRRLLSTPPSPVARKFMGGGGALTQGAQVVGALKNSARASGGRKVGRT